MLWELVALKQKEEEQEEMEEQEEAGALAGLEAYGGKEERRGCEARRNSGDDRHSPANSSDMGAFIHWTLWGGQKNPKCFIFNVSANMQNIQGCVENAPQRLASGELAASHS